MNKKIRLILDWCIRRYGTSIFYDRLPTLRIDNKEVGVYYGTFDEELCEITVYVAKCGSLNEIIKTVIHEYIHYMQPPGIYEIVEFYNEGSYHKNPLEQWASKIEKRDWSICKKELNLK